MIKKLKERIRKDFAAAVYLQITKYKDSFVSIYGSDHTDEISILDYLIDKTCDFFDGSNDISLKKILNEFAEIKANYPVN